MSLKSKYDVILDTMPATEHRKEIIFRLAGDDAIMVEYGREMVFDYMDIFRNIAVNKEIQQRVFAGYSLMDGFIGASPAIRTSQYVFDLRKKTIEEMLVAIKDVELSIGDERDMEKMVFSSPIIEQPIAFEDPQIRETNERYLKEVKRVDSSPDIDPVYGDSITYMANYVGISREEWKEKFFSTDYFACNMGFLVGLVDWIPLDRRCTLRTSKSNPPRVWTCRSAVALGSYLLSWYPVAAAGGYHLIGRTSPLVQFEQCHPSFKEDVALYHTLDRIKWYEVSPDELLTIEKLVDSGSSEFVYKKTPGWFSVGEWLEFDRQHKREIDTWFKQIQESAAKAPVP